MSDGTGDAAGGAPEGPVLVVGGAGYIGSHTVRALEERGVPVVVLDNLSTGHRAAVRSELVVADLADASALADVFEQPLRIDRSFDLAMSVEVAEHLPPSTGPRRGLT